MYEGAALEQPEPRAALPELRGKDLLCGALPSGAMARCSCG